MKTIDITVTSNMPATAQDKLRLFFRGYFAAIVATATLVPGALAFVTVVTYLALSNGTNGMHTLSRSWIIVATFWFSAAFLYRHRTTAEHSIPSSFGELCPRLTQLKTAVERLRAEGVTRGRRAAALIEASDQIVEMEKELSQPGLPWVLARGYITAWDRMYRAEEALIEVEHPEVVLAGALYDELRLQDSRIDNCEDLLTKLRQAVNVMDSKAAQYLKPGAPGTKQLEISTASLLEGAVNEHFHHRLQAAGGTPPYKWNVPAGMPDNLDLDEDTGLLKGRLREAKCILAVRVTDKAGLMTEKQLTLTVKGAGTPPEPAAGATPESVARAMLRTVRRSINEYRGKSWNGLIVARNRLLGTMLAVALIAYAVLAIAIMVSDNAQKDAIVAASVLFLVGATVGLFSRLRTQSNADTAVSDYGLSAARVVTIPVFNGLAAIGGVVLVAISSSDSKPSLQAALNLGVSTLVTAAVFGLTPELFFDRLLKQTETLKGNLKSSEATQEAKQT